MRNRLIFLFSLLSFTSAKAEVIDRVRANLGADIVPYCRIKSINFENQNGVNTQINSAGAAVWFDNFVDSATLYALPLNINFQVAAICNNANILKVTSAKGGFDLINGAVNSNSFASHRNYSANISWGGINSSFSTNATNNQGITQTLYGAIDDIVFVHLNAAASNQPMVAGTYEDVISINLSSAW